MTAIASGPSKARTKAFLLAAALAGTGLLSLATGSALRAQPAGPVVTVTGGQVQGSPLAAGGAVFKGLPFAAPPVGALRWDEPHPVLPWQGVRQATDYGHTCAQNDGGWNHVAAMRGSEDCLYLNVWTPGGPVTSRKPVMLWIHGGANAGGSALGAGAIEPPFDGESLSRHGVVVVTINYRLGVFGFIGHPELTARSPHHASGDYGLLDQIAALRWVHDNIARFGGDPGNVTVFGKSAGGQNTSILVASPLTRGLMHKAIVESGSPMMGDNKMLTPAQTAHLGEILAKTVNAPASGAIDYLRGLSTQQILDAVPELRKNLSAEKLRMDVSTDGYAVPEWPAHTYRDKREPAIPMIMGTVAQDSPGYHPSADTSPQATEAAVRKRVEVVYGRYPDLKAKALGFYGLDGGKPLVAPSSYGPLDLQVNVDHGFRCVVSALAGWHDRIAPTYQYEFTAGTPGHPPLHTAELDFIFGYLRDQGQVPVLNRLSQQMQAYWTNFAKTGNPNGAGLPEWPRYGATRNYVDLGNDGPVAKSDLRGALCGLYAEKLDRFVRADQ